MKNLTNSWKTTLLGTIIIILSLASVFYVDGITWWPDALSAVTVGLLLLFAPDDIINTLKGMLKGRAGKDTLIVFLFFALFFACKSNQLDFDLLKQQAENATELISTPVEINVPADKVSFAGKLTMADTTVTSGRARLNLTTTPEQDSLIADCDCLEVHHTDTVLQEVPVFSFKECAIDDHIPRSQVEAMVNTALKERKGKRTTIQLVLVFFILAAAIVIIKKFLP